MYHTQCEPAGKHSPARGIALCPASFPEPRAKGQPNPFDASGVADEVGVEWETVYRWYRGTHNPFLPKPILFFLDTLLRRKPIAKARSTRRSKTNA